MPRSFVVAAVVSLVLVSPLSIRTVAQAAPQSAGVSTPAVVGSKIAGTFADASGHSGQSHLFYAANAGVWWLLTLTSSADSPGGANHLVKAYHTTGPDLATATWVAAADSPGASAAQSVNCGNCFMGGGRALGVAYVNNAPADVVHAEVAMAFDGQDGLTAHIRATVTATTIAWDAWSYYDAPAATWALPRAVTLGVSTGKVIHSGGPTLQQEVDANVRVSTAADTGSTWTNAFSPVSLIDNSMFHQSNAMTFAALAGNRMLSVYDNGGGQASCYLCQGGPPEPSLTNLGYRRSNVDGSWPTLPPGNQVAGDGSVFAADATIDQNDWVVVSSDTSSIFAFRRDATGTGLDAAAYNVATNTWSPFTEPPPFGAGRSHKAGSGVFGVASGPRIWLFVIVDDAANSILYSKYEASAWTAWQPVPGTDTETHVRNFLSGYPSAAAGQLGLIWTEGTAPYDVMTTSMAMTSTVPNLAGLTQASAVAAITAAGLTAGSVTTTPSAVVPIGSVVSQNPPASSEVAAGTAVDLVVSTGVVVPDVVGQTQDAAQASIAAVAGLVVGTVTSATSETVAAGLVISQDPVAGANVSGGSRIDLLVSSGPPVFVPAPDVVNMTQAEATTAITNAGLAVGTITQSASLSVPAGRIISQDPIAGSQVLLNGAVNLVVSTGLPLVTVPSVAGQTLNAATSTLQNAQLVVGSTTNAISTTVPAGAVISQNPPAGTQVVVGSAISLVVSSGPPPPVPVPNVVNLTQAQATSAITTAGFVVGAITTASSATVPSGSVISQAPAGGTLATPGTAVSIVVSTGPAAPSPTVDIVVFSDGNGSRTTSKFSTAAANELLVAFVSADGPATGPQTATVTGAGLTWTLVRRGNTQGGTSEVWQARAAARLVNVSVTSNTSVGGVRQSLTVVAFRGASGIGASAVASALTGPPSVTLVTTKANALVYGVGNDWDRAVARTLGAGQVMVHQSVVTTVGDTFWVQSRTAAVAAAGTAVQINCTAPSNDRWNLVSVEIVP